jgi:hypothetical protein
VKEVSKVLEVSKVSKVFFDSNKSYAMSFYKTRLDQNSLVPASVQLGNYQGNLYIPDTVFSGTFFGCDTSYADFAFIITDGSGSRMNGSNSQNEQSNYDLTSHENRVNENNTEDSESNFEVKIIPNPSSSIFNIYVSSQENLRQEVELFVYNTLGNLVLHKQRESKPFVDLSEYPKGIYLLKISFNNIVKYYKLIHS